MTYSTSPNNENQSSAIEQEAVSPVNSSEIGAMLATNADDIIPPQAPAHYDTFTNPTTGALYYYIRGGASSPGNNKNYKNSWVFNPPGKDFQGNPPYDPSLGNLWVDRNNTYLVYVWNSGENVYADVGWMALTTKKRAYDHFVLQLAETPDDLVPIVEDPTALTYSIYKQGYIYFNVNNLNLYVWNGEVDEWGVATNPTNTDAWVAITQHELTPDQTVQSTFSMLKDEISALEADIASLKSQVSD